VRLGVLVSGRGSNLAAVLEAVASGRLATVQPILVITNRASVPALAVAERHGVPTRVLRRADFASRDARDAAIGSALAAARVELTLLAGYDQRLEAGYFAAFGGRTINIHPSLLPRHGGRGMMGLAVHEAVLAAGDRETGVTIHDVTPQLDAGRTLRQVRVRVDRGERAEQLADRVLAVEHATLVEMLEDLARRGLDWEPSASMTGAPGAVDAVRG
jgi:phosphoribosylglycinamide formyltransferase 1